jgi:hypothetical protein
VNVPVARAADKELVYHQSTGILTLAGKKFASGYSGKGKGKNNPDKEKEKSVGPIPRGNYKIGKPKEWKGMKHVFDLTSDGHNAHGRTAFLIHGDSKKNPGNASEGCIILSPQARKRIADSGITRLKVVKD